MCKLFTLSILLMVVLLSSLTAEDRFTYFMREEYSATTGTEWLELTDNERQVYMSAYMGTCLAIMQQLTFGDSLAVMEDDFMQIFYPTLTRQDAVKRTTEFYEDHPEYHKSPAIAVIQYVMGQRIYDF